MPRLPRILLLLAIGLLAGGCASFTRAAARAAAEEPYRKAMLAGRMTQVDYQQKRHEIREQAEPVQVP